METFQTSLSLGDETSQMWSLNKRLEAYLSRVKALEEENELLRAEIHHLRKESKVPSVRTYHEEIMKLRDALDDGQQKVVEAEMARDDMYQEMEYVKDLCLQEKQAQEEAKKEISESKKLLEEEKRAQAWLKQRLDQLEEEMEDILRVHEEEKVAMEEEMASLSRRLDCFKAAPVAFQPVNVEDYSIKLAQIWQGAVEDYKNEVSVMEGNLSQATENLRKVLEENKQSQLQLQNLDRELTSLKSRKEMLEEALAKQWLDQQDEEGRLQLEVETLEKEKQDLRAQIAQVLEDRQQLMHLKMSLSLEVATYRSLLEAESTRIYSPTADYRLSSPFSEPLLERTPLRKRQAESTKTPVARDYRLLSTKRQTVEKSEQLSHTPSHHLNVKSTSFSSRPSPVTKEFQKVSSVLQSQSLKYTKASSEKAATTSSSVERTIKRRPPTEDVFKKSKVETISHAYSQGSSKTIQDNTVRSEQKDQPLDKTVYSKNDAGLTKTEAVENGFLLPREEKILDAHLKTDCLESSLKTVKDHHRMVHNIALEGQQGSLKVDINGQDLQSNDRAQEEKDNLNFQQKEFDLLSQVIENVEADLVVEKEEVVTEVATRQTVLFKKQEVVQSLDYQNIETLMKEDVTDHRMLQAISEPYTSDEKAEVLAITPTHEQDSRTTLISAEREEPQTLSSDVGSEYEPLAQQRQEFYGQVSFDPKHAISDVKEGIKQWVDKQDTLMVNQDLEIPDTEQDNASLKVETESKLQEEEVIVNQQIINTLKESNKQLFNDEKVIDESDITDEIIFDSPESFDKCLGDALNGLQVNELSKEIDLGNTEQHTYEVIVSQEIHSLSSEIDHSPLIDSEIKKTDNEPQQEVDLKLVQSDSLLEERKDSTDTVVQEENQLSDIKEEIHHFEGVKTSGVDDSAQACDTEQSSEAIGMEGFVNLPQGNEQTSEDSKKSQEVNQEEQKHLELRSLEQETEIYTERKTQIICFTEQITEQFIVDNEEVIDQLNDVQSQNLYSSKTGLNEIQKELESLECSDKEQETHDILGADDVQLTKLESEEATSQLIDATQDTVQLLENVRDSQDVNLEEQKLSEPRDDEQDQSNLKQELNIQLSEDNQNLDDHNTEDNIQLLNDIDDGDQSVDKSQEQLCDIKPDSSIVPETEPVDINLAQPEQDNKLGLEQDISPSESKETILSAEDVIEERSDEQTSLSFDSAENYVNAIVEKHALSQFGALELNSGKTFPIKEDSTPDDLQSLQPQVEEEGDVPSETDGTTYLQNEDVEHPAEETYELHFKQDIVDATTIINTVQENQPEEHESEEIFTGTNETEADIQVKESEQASQELVNSVACALLREEVLLESPRSAKEVQEPEPSYDAERKTTYQNESEEITQWTENVIIKESCEVLSTAAECTFSEEHEVDTKLVHKVCDLTEEEGSTMTNLEPERKLPENETEECISESENIESDDLTPVGQQSKGPAADQELELDHESISDTHPKPTFQKEPAEEYSTKDTQEGTSHDNCEDVSTENDEGHKDCRDLEADQELECDQLEVSADAEAKGIDEYSSQATEEKSSQGDSETTGQKTLVENERDSKDSRDPEADQESELQQESTEEYSSQDTKEKNSQDNLETVRKTTAQDTLAENEDSKDSMNPTDNLKPELDQEDVSDSKISYEQESVETHADEDTEEKISEVSSESISETLEKDTFEENEEDSKYSRKSETDQEPVLDQESLSSTGAKITYQPESAFVSTMIQDVFSEEIEEVEQLTQVESVFECTGYESHTPEIRIEKYISGSENTESAAESVVEPVSQESRDLAPDQKMEPDQEQLSDIQQEIALQQEDADEFSIKGPEEQACQDNLETVSKITKQGTTEEDEQDSKISKDSEGNQEQEIVDTDTQFTLEQKNEEVCFSKAAEEIKSQETDEGMSKTAEQDTTVENQEDSKDSMNLEVVQETKLDHEDVSDFKITYQQESALDSNEGKDEEISQESCEVVSTMVENVFFGKNEEVEQLGQTEFVVASMEHERHTPEVKTENTESDAYLCDVEPVSQKPQDPEPNQKPKPHQEQLSDMRQEIPLQQEGTDDPKEQASQDNLEIVTKITGQDTTEEDEQDIKDTRNSEANHGQGLVEELLINAEPQFTLEQKYEDVCFSEATVEEISQETDGAISKTAAQDTIVENQGDIKDSWDSQAEHGQELVKEALFNTELEFTCQQIEETYSSNFEEEVVLQETDENFSKTAVQDTFKDHQEKEMQLPELGKADEISGFDNAEETPQLNDYEPVSKELKDPELDQDPNVDSDSQRPEEDKLNFQLEGEHETDSQSCDVKDLNQDIHAAISLVEACTTSEEKQTEQMEQNDSKPEQPGFPLISSELENECSESKSEESVSASDATQNNVRSNDPEATIQETEQASDQCSEAITTSQWEIEDGHLKHSGEVKEVSEENYEAASTADDCNKFEENEEVASSQKEPEDDQKIPFSLTMIQNNLRFISENDAEVQQEKQECESSVDGGDRVDDEKTSESADLQSNDINHDSLNKEELISEDKDFTESELDNVSEPSYQDSTSAQEPNTQNQENQAKYLEPETNEKTDEQPIALETESEAILVEQNIEQELFSENPAVTFDFEGPTEEQSEIEDVQIHCNPDDEISKSDESIDSQDISLFSQKSEDFEISKDYQLEQTLPDSTPLPILDDEFEDLTEDKVVITSDEAQKVSGSHFLSELKEEVLEDNLESQIAKELKAEDPKQDLGENTFSTLDEPTFDDNQLEDSEVSKAENENTESDESLNSQGDISISSQRSDNLEACGGYQLEEAQPDTTTLSNLTVGPEMLAEEQVSSEPPQIDDEFQKVDTEQSGLAADESKKETESVSETAELSSTAERSESELVTLNSDIIEEESSYTHAEQNVHFYGEDNDSLEKEEKDIKEDQSELITKEFAQGLSTKLVIDSNETEDVIIIDDHNRDVTQIQNDESNEGLKTDPFGTTNDESQVEDTETLENTQEDIEVVAKTLETSVILESDNSISSEETSPNVTAIGHETEPEDNTSNIEETSTDINVIESSDEFAEVGLKEVEETREEEELLTSQPGQEAGIPEHIEINASEEEKDTTGETSDSSFDSNSGNERESAEEQHFSPTENIYVKPVNGLHGNTIVQATLDFEDLLVNGHSTGEQGKIVISERKTIVKVEEDIINIHTQDIIEESVLKFATSEGKSEGLFQSLLEKAELKEGTLLDDPSEIKDTIHTAVQFVDSATDESDYTKKTLKPYLDSDFSNQTEIQPFPVAEGIFVDSNQQTVKTHQVKEDSWSSDE